MGVPRVYRKEGERSIITYNYTDIASGTGYIIFYGAEHQETTVSGGYLLTGKTFSNTILSYGTAETTSFVEVVDKDFDVLFNTPSRVKGKIRVTLTLGSGSQNINSAAETYAIVKAVHIDAATNETPLGQAQTETMIRTTTTAETAFSQTVNVEIDIADIRRFKKGETLRITVGIWGKKTSTNASYQGFGHDPMDRNDTPTNPDFNMIEDDDTTIFAVHIPFLLDL